MPSLVPRPRASCVYHRFRCRLEALFIVPVGNAFALRLNNEFLGLYSSANDAAQAAASGRARMASGGVNMLRLNAPFDLERWETLPLSRAMERDETRQVDEASLPA